jgi:predicted DNA-binding transcriptional regulator YafY
MKIAKVLRLLKLIRLLQAGRGQNADELARSCGVSKRTIFRDFDILRQAGVPLSYDETSQQHRILGNSYLPPTNFTPEEALALIVLSANLGDGSQLPFFEPARNAAIKIESSLPERLREHLRASAGGIKIRIPPNNPLIGQEVVYEQLLAAQSERRAVRLRYFSPSDSKVISTRLHPYQLLFSRRSWYIIGRASLYRETRTFNIGRIQHLEVLDDHYEIPRGFSLGRYLRNAWHLIPERGPDSQILIRFSKLVSHNVAEVQWHKTQRTQFNPDETLDFHVTVSGLHEIAWWILGYGDQAEVIRPPELRQIVANRAALTVAKYAK